MDRSLYDQHLALWSASYRHWQTSELFSFGWFFNITFLIILYTVWLILVDKKRLKDLLLFGALISVAAGFIDIIAVCTGIGFLIANPVPPTAGKHLPILPENIV